MRIFDVALLVVVIVAFFLTLAYLRNAPRDCCKGGCCKPQVLPMPKAE